MTTMDATRLAANQQSASLEHKLHAAQQQSATQFAAIEAMVARLMARKENSKAADRAPGPSAGVGLGDIRMSSGESGTSTSTGDIGKGIAMQTRIITAEVVELGQSGTTPGEGGDGEPNGGAPV